jgi:hypothetical protein
MQLNQSWLAAVQWGRPGAGWADKSMLAFAGQPLPGSQVPPNVMLARDERTSRDDHASETPEAYALRQCGVLKASLPGCHIVQQGPLQACSVPGQQVLFKWQAGANALVQWVVWLPMPDGSMLSFTATCEAAHWDSQRPQFEAALHKLQLQPQHLPPRVAR